jgi:hypothetical protein
MKGTEISKFLSSFNYIFHYFALSLSISTCIEDCNYYILLLLN